MKIKNLLKKLFFVSGTIAVCFATIFSTAKVWTSQNKNNSNKSSSAVSFIDSDAYIKHLLENGGLPEADYSLLDHYPIFSENQMTSDLCWIYSSSKALELSLMVQRQEYYNFSEMGTALLGNLNGINNINDTGDFKKYNMITQNYGVIHGSDLSNDSFIDINNDNAKNYNSVIENADKTFMENIKPILISEDVFFGSRSQEERILILKQYIVEFGGFYSGLRTGKISYSDNSYTEILPDPNKPNSPLDNITSPDKAIKQPHAVCIVGWDEKKGWIALNSWGRSALDYETFYIPYDVGHVYETASGYICLECNSVSLTNSSAKAFSQEILTGSNSLKNLFISGEEISLSYKISDKIEFDEVYVNIYSGEQNVTNSFSLDFSEDKIFNLSSLPEKQESYASEYTIRFYANEKLFSMASFYVYSGTELSYVELVKGNTSVDSIQLNNTLSSGKSVATYLVSSGGISDVDFKLNIAILETMQADSNVTAVAGKVYETNFTSGDVSNKQENSSISLSINPQLTGTQCQYTVSIYGLTKNNAGKLIEFSIVLTSLKTGCETEYNFKFFISTNQSATTASLNSIAYELNGGKNSKQNITRYPNYQQESSMTEFLLETPTREDSAEFLGWYLDAEYKNAISKISQELAGDIVLYAKWKEEEKSYFSLNFEISSLLGYGETAETEYSVEDIITYGDSVNLTLSYLPNTAILAGYNFHAKYHYYLDGKEVSSATLNEAGDTKINNSFKNLSSGQHKATINVIMVISRSFSVSLTKEISFSVSQKLLSAEKTEFEYKYDRTYHTPKLNLVGVLSEDDGVVANLQPLEEKNNISEKDVGIYEYKITGINNSNYIFAEENIVVMKITQADFFINFTVGSVLTYIGAPQKLTYNQTNTGDDLVEVRFSYYRVGSSAEISSSDFKNVGTYKVVPSIASKNYKLTSSEEYIFSITKAKAKIIFNDIEERYTVAPNNRKKITYKIEGLVGSDTASCLNINSYSDGLSAKNSGSYPITGSCTSENYDITIVNGTYKILGYYRVYYTLPNGKVYEEIVDDGFNPKGISKEIYKKPFLSKLVYDKELVQGDGDLVVKVSYVSYTWLFITIISVSVIVVAYFVLTRQIRRMKNR